MSQIRKFYGQTSFGQVHARIAPSVGDELLPPLICLHPAPSSGLYFATAMPMLDEGRRVVAPDYPGYGGSDPPPSLPSIFDYARAMLEFLDDVQIDLPVDVLGFHTGCLVGSEMALQAPAAIRRLVLCDVPYFLPDTRKNLFEQMAKPMPVTGELSSIEGAWSFDVAERIDEVPLPRALQLFAEHLRAGQREHYAFAAAFSYDCDKRLPQLTTDTVVLATQSGLHDASLSAAEAIPDATLVDVTEVTTAVFESGADAICRRINAALS